jgi:hypothetical protein
MSIRITGVAKPDLTQFNVVAPNKARLPIFKQLATESGTSNTVIQKSDSKSSRAQKKRKRAAGRPNWTGAPYHFTNET